MGAAAANAKNRRDYLDPVREAEAVKALRAALGDQFNGDETLLVDTIEGETRLFEVVDALLERIREAEIQIAGIDAVLASLGERKRRNEEAQKRDRALIEQAMAIAELNFMARPTGTLTLADRPAQLVVSEEADVPAQFWKAGDPKLDRKALAEAVKEREAQRKAALEAAEDEEGRKAALAAFPPIPGATLNNGAPSLTIRTK